MDMPHWSWIPEATKRGPERRGQKGPPEEALVPEARGADLEERGENGPLS